MMHGQKNIKQNICCVCNRYYVSVFRQVTCTVSVFSYSELLSPLFIVYDVYCIKFGLLGEILSALFKVGTFVPTVLIVLF